jgi:hypothetical protein
VVHIFRPRESLDEQVRRKGLKPIKSTDDLICDAFETDEELDAFIAFVYAERQANLI